MKKHIVYLALSCLFTIHGSASPSAQSQQKSTLIRNCVVLGTGAAVTYGFIKKPTKTLLACAAAGGVLSQSEHARKEVLALLKNEDSPTLTKLFENKGLIGFYVCYVGGAYIFVKKTESFWWPLPTAASAALCWHVLNAKPGEDWISVLLKEEPTPPSKEEEKGTN